MNYYYSFKQYLTKMQGCKIWRIPLSTGYPCPNRLEGRPGCTFCDGSSFIASYMKDGSTLREQMSRAMEFFGNRYRVDRFYAYFQENSSTYGDLCRLKGMFETALADERVRGLIISTRPDCIDQAVVELLAELESRYSDRDIWLELGLQSVYDETLARIERGHNYADFREAVRLVQDKSRVKIGVHMIIGLPGETPLMFREGMYKLFRENRLQGVKLRLLDILEGTPIYDEYKREPESFHHFTNREYITLLCDILEEMPPDVVIMRTLNYNPVNILNKDDKVFTKDQILTELRNEFERRGTCQGSRFQAV